MTRHGPDDYGSLNRLLMDFIRSFALLRPDQVRPEDQLSLSQGFALAELASAAPLSQRDLAERLNLDKSTVSRLVADLDRRGFLERRPDPTNRRFFRLTITDMGRAALDDVLDAYYGRHARMFAALTPGEREGLRLGLTALLQHFHPEPHTDRAGADTRRQHPGVGER